MAALVLLKSVKNGKLFQDPKSKVKCIYIENVRASYPFVGTPGKDESEDGSEARDSWRVVGMLPKDTHGEVKKMCDDLIKELKAANDNVSVPSDMFFIQDGDGEKYDPNDDKLKLMNGHWLVSAKDGRIRPRCYNQKGEVIDDISKIDDMFYGGCWINLMIRPWYFNGIAKGKTKKFPKRMLAGLSSVQFHHDDTPFGTGRIDDTGVFGAVEGGGNGMDDDDEL